MRYKFFAHHFSRGNSFLKGQGIEKDICVSVPHRFIHHNLKLYQTLKYIFGLTFCQMAPLEQIFDRPEGEINNIPFFWQNIICIVSNSRILHAILLQVL